MSRPYDETENKRPVKVVKKRGVLGKILFFFLGLILGMVLIAGSVFGVGYYAFTRPSKDPIRQSKIHHNLPRGSVQKTAQQ